MSGRKVTIVIDNDAFSLLEKRAKDEGFGRVSTLIRHLTVSGMKEPSNGNKVALQVDGYDEVASYVKEKKFGSIAVFANFAMEQYMQRVPLTEAQRERVGKSIN